MQPIIRLLVVVALFATCSVTTSQHPANACDRCNGNAACKKVCRLVREEKKVEVTCWGYECEEFCIPGPSKPGCTHCETVCEFCEEESDAVAHPKKFQWTKWIPGCATMQTRKKLMKRTVTKTIPSYKWVVEDLCETCHASLSREEGLHDAALKLAGAALTP